MENSPHSTVNRAQIDRFADRLQEEMRDTCIGFAFDISSGNDYSLARVGYHSRLPQSHLARAIQSTWRMNIVDLSMTITAAALLHALHSGDLSPDEPIAPFLPSDWQQGAHITDITFRQLLDHTGGFQTEGYSFLQLRASIAKGVLKRDIGKEKYRQFNYCLMRILIPHLPFGQILLPKSNKAPDFYANAYMGYVQRHLFDPIGIPPASCHPTEDTSQALVYRLPLSDKPGVDLGDMTLTNGSRGWYLSAEELGILLRTLHFTHKLLPKSLSDAMRKERLGYDAIGKTSLGTGYCVKRGSYCDIFSGGTFTGGILIFDNTIAVVVLVNSNLAGKESLEEIVTRTFDEVFPSYPVGSL